MIGLFAKHNIISLSGIIWLVVIRNYENFRQSLDWPNYVICSIRTHKIWLFLNKTVILQKQLLQITISSNDMSVTLSDIAPLYEKHWPNETLQSKRPKEQINKYMHVTARNWTEWLAMSRCILICWYITTVQGPMAIHRCRYRILTVNIDANMRQYL